MPLINFFFLEKKVGISWSANIVFDTLGVFHCKIDNKLQMPFSLKYDILIIHANLPDLVGIFPIWSIDPDFPIGICKLYRNPDFVNITTRYPDFRHEFYISRDFCLASQSEIGIQGCHYCLPVAHVVIWDVWTCVGRLIGVNWERVLIVINRHVLYTQRTT